MQRPTDPGPSTQPCMPSPAQQRVSANQPGLFRLNTTVDPNHRHTGSLPTPPPSAGFGSTRTGIPLTHMYRTTDDPGRFQPADQQVPAHARMASLSADPAYARASQAYGHLQMQHPQGRAQNSQPPSLGQHSDIVLQRRNSQALEDAYARASRHHAMNPHAHAQRSQNASQQAQQVQHAQHQQQRQQHPHAQRPQQPPLIPYRDKPTTIHIPPAHVSPRLTERSANPTSTGSEPSRSGQGPVLQAHGHSIPPAAPRPTNPPPSSSSAHTAPPSSISTSASTSSSAPTSAPVLPPFNSALWDPMAHAGGTFGGLRLYLERLLASAESTLGVELTHVKAGFGAREREVVRLLGAELDGARRERDEARKERDDAMKERDEARELHARVRAQLERLYGVAVGLSEECERVRGERERLREEGWKLGEAVARLAVERGMHNKGDGEEGKGGDADALLTGLLAQARKEYERRVQVEKELDVFKRAFKFQQMTPGTTPNPAGSLPIRFTHTLSELASLHGLECSTSTSTSTPTPSSTTVPLPPRPASSTPTPAPAALSAAPMPTPEPSTRATSRQDSSVAAFANIRDVLASMGTDFGIGLGLPLGLATPASGGRTSPGGEVIDLTGDGEGGEQANKLNNVAPFTRVGERVGSEVVAGAKRTRSPSVTLAEVLAKRRRVVSEGVDLARVGGDVPARSSTVPLGADASSASAAPPPAAGVDDPDRTLVNACDTDSTMMDAELSAMDALDMELQYDEDEDEGEVQKREEESKPDVGEGRGVVSAVETDPDPDEMDQLKADEDVEGQMRRLVKTEQEEAKPCVDVGVPGAEESTVAPLEVEEEKEEDEEMDEGELEPVGNSQDSEDALPDAGVHTSRKQLSISHLPLIYETRGTTLVCRMCRQRKIQFDHTLSVTTYPEDSSWALLAGHCETEHPSGFERLVSMSSKQIAEAKLRR